MLLDLLFIRLLNTVCYFLSGWRNGMLDFPPQTIAIDRFEAGYFFQIVVYRFTILAKLYINFKSTDGFFYIINECFIIEKLIKIMKIG